MANSNDLPKEMKELVVEEKANETNWNNLPFEMKEMIIKEMNLETRTRLKLCSKSDKYLVESIRMPFDELDCMVDKRYDKFSVKLRSSKCRAHALMVEVTSFEKGVSIIKRDQDGFREVDKFPCSKEEGELMGPRMFESIIFNRNLRFNSVKVWITCPDVFEDSEFTIHTKRIDIRAPKHQVIQWLKNVAPGVEEVKANTYIPHSEQLEGIGNIPAVINAKKFESFSANDINDEQLVNFNCTSIIIDGESNITGKGINQLIKKALAGDYPKGTHIEIAVNQRDLFQMWKDINKGFIIDEITQEYNNTDQVVFTGRIEMTEKKRMEYSLKKQGFLMDILV